MSNIKRFSESILRSLGENNSHTWEEDMLQIESNRVIELLNGIEDAFGRYQVTHIHSALRQAIAKAEEV